MANNDKYNTLSRWLPFILSIVIVVIAAAVKVESIRGDAALKLEQHKIECSAAISKAILQHEISNREINYSQVGGVRLENSELRMSQDITEMKLEIKVLAKTIEVANGIAIRTEERIKQIEKLR